MAIRVLFFASLREAVGEHEILIDEVGDDKRLSALVSRLATRFDADARKAITAENVRIAVNRELVHGDILLDTDDEVAFLPPVTGG